MKAPTAQEITGICSVTALAAQVRLSRPRFYELVAAGVFPRPRYSPRTKRPFYPPDLQMKCLEIRRTGIDLGGQPVVFNTPRRQVKSREPPVVDYDELTRMLRGMELKVAKHDVQKAVAYTTVRNKPARPRPNPPHRPATRPSTGTPMANRPAGIFTPAVVGRPGERLLRSSRNWNWVLIQYEGPTWRSRT